ncbi:MAG: thioredoxin family protein [Polaromonas sp.]|nr:thioredoxin family protein [Polaromonas sp.]
MAAHPAVKHLKVEGGINQELGRSFKLTLLFLAEGKEVARLVRPKDDIAAAQVLATIDPMDASVCGSSPRPSAVTQQSLIVHSIKLFAAQ